MAQVIASKKGGKVLMYQGYSYQLNTTGTSNKYWICSAHSSGNCNGRLITSRNIPAVGESVDVINESKNHNHTPDPASMEKRQVVNKVKAMASTSSDSTSTIVATAIQGASVACLGKRTRESPNAFVHFHQLSLLPALAFPFICHFHRLSPTFTFTRLGPPFHLPLSPTFTFSNLHFHCCIQLLSSLTVVRRQATPTYITQTQCAKCQACQIPRTLAVGNIKIRFSDPRRIYKTCKWQQLSVV